MKIVQICPYAMDRPGGVQRHIRDLSAWLNAQGHETRVIAPPAPGALPQRHDAVWEVGRARRIALHGTAFELSLAAPWAVRRLAQDLRNWGADLVHLHTPWTPALAGQIWRALRLPRVTTIHATLPEAQHAGLVDRYIRRAARRYVLGSDAVVTPSPAPLALLTSLVPGLAAEILPPAVDLSGFAPAPKTPMSCLFLGRLEPRKGLDVVLRAWPEIAARHPRARLTVAGAGPLDSALPDGVRHLPAPSDADVQREMARAEVFLAPAPYGESYGLVLAEAMAAGALPVAADNPGYAHVLRDLTELLVPAGDHSALAARVSQVLTQDQTALRARLPELARASDVTRAGPDYLRLYEAVLAAR